MVIEIDSLENYEDFIKDISIDQCFSDPHFSYDSGNLYRALEKKNQRVYVTKQNGVVTGIYAWFVIPEEQYVELIVGLSRRRESWEEMLSFIETQNPNSKMDFVINPQNKVLIDILISKQATFEEETKKLRLVRRTELNINGKVEELSEKYKNQYLSLHNKDTYWTGERVLEAKDRFRVLVAIEHEEVVGYLDITSSFPENEPYDLFTKEGIKEYRKALISKAIELNKPKGMMVQVEANNTEDISMYVSLGFDAIKGSDSIYAYYKMQQG